MPKIVLSKNDMRAIIDYPTSHDIEWPNKVVYPGPGQKPLSLALTYTKLKDFESCPRKFMKKHLTHEIPYTDTPATLWGTHVHSSYEDYVLNDKPLPKDVREKVGSTAPDKIIDIENKLYDDGKLAVPLFGEQKWAMDATGRYANWMDSKGVFMRGMADAGLGTKKVLYMFDYKTGKDKNPDVTQFDVLSLLAVAQPQFTQYTDIRGMLMFVEARSVYPKTGIYQVDMTPGMGHLNMLRLWQKKAIQVVDYYQREYWPENQSVLCKWCPDKTCPFNTSDDK